MTKKKIRWTPEMGEELKKRWDAGETGSQIAAALGVSRNSVIGKANRMGLSVRKAGVKRKYKPRKARKLRPMGDLQTANRIAWKRRVYARREETEPPKEGFKNLDLMQLTERTCRWPVYGERAETLFCGNECDIETPYCDFHSRQAYQFAKEDQ